MLSKDQLLLVLLVGWVQMKGKGVLACYNAWNLYGKQGLRPLVMMLYGFLDFYGLCYDGSGIVKGIA